MQRSSWPWAAPAHSDKPLPSGIALRSPHTHAGHLQPRSQGDLAHLAPSPQGTSSLWAAPAPEDSPSSPVLAGARHRYTTRAAKAATGGGAPSLAPPEEEGSGDSGSGLPSPQPAASKRGEGLSAGLGDFQPAGPAGQVGLSGSDGELTLHALRI